MTVSWLKQGVIPLSPGLPLAQPFAQPVSANARSVQPVSAEALEGEWQRQYEALPAAVKGLLSFEHFRAQSGELASSIRTAAREREYGRTPSYDLGRLAKARVARLFPSALSYLAWRDLAEGFSGLAVAMLSRHASLASQEGRPALLAPVQYGGEHRYQVTALNPFPGLLLDHPACADNQEWRLLMPESTAPVRPGPEGVSQPVLPIQRGLITGLYWSVNTPEETVAEIRQLVARDMRFRSVALGKVVPDPGRWQLQLQPVRTS
ncbi:hypothetical protein [Saccharospirillum impatiens]|uniref:hypothetical protein n=1 Tax=Saccharospirillum impatiens TaxID=169438 RepID=UPI0003F9AF83|nr:hypothetical protein [Saccharospirillum impatiens]